MMSAHSGPNSLSIPLHLHSTCFACMLDSGSMWSIVATSTIPSTTRATSVPKDEDDIARLGVRQEWKVEQLLWKSKRRADERAQRQLRRPRN
jgi:hypothetical protein